MLGIGANASMNEAPLGIVWPEPKERFARLKEATELIKQLWASDRVDSVGTYYSVLRAIDRRACCCFESKDHLIPYLCHRTMLPSVTRGRHTVFPRRT